MKKIIIFIAMLTVFVNCSENESDNDSLINKEKVLLKTVTYLNNETGEKAEVLSLDYNNDDVLTDFQFYINQNEILKLKLQYDTKENLIEYKTLDERFKAKLEYNAQGKVTKQTISIEDKKDAVIKYSYNNGKLAEEYTTGLSEYYINENKYTEFKTVYSYSLNKIIITKYIIGQSQDIKDQQTTRTLDNKGRTIKLEEEYFNDGNTNRVIDVTNFTYDNNPTPYSSITDVMSKIFRISDFSLFEPNNILTENGKYSKIKREYEYNAKGYPTRIIELRDEGEFTPEGDKIFKGNYKEQQEIIITYIN